MTEVLMMRQRPVFHKTFKNKGMVINMLDKRTDLAVEARELYYASTEKKSELKGVIATDSDKQGFPVTTVEILDEDGARALSKPVGKYITITLEGFREHVDDAFGRGVTLLASELNQLLALQSGDSVLVAGLGNLAITPDALGPKVVDSLMVTRHLVEKAPEHFATFRPVSAIAPGVLGTTGIESREIIRAVVDNVRPSAVIAVDALASCSLKRVCRTIQLSDTGIAPGSGVGNSRAVLNKNALGVPVIALGVPTVVDAATLSAELADIAGYHNIDEEELRKNSEHMIVTPRGIDTDISDLSKLIGYGINLALHNDFTIEDITMFLS